ncbi:MAG: acylneuraminate cytidylyltransferase family protein [Pseudorhodoplanes sp.]|jgi:CMP-N-acetylneuraminic acid synthetase|nr:acylneuraminate cytidylyltransferase family protein [Pseudorhodoplanes sp.]
MSDAVEDILALIPARGGSKGLPQKNILPCAGRPLIAHTIAAALTAQMKRVVVSTDDPAIAEISRQNGAEVPFMRPQALATDAARSIDVVTHALTFFDQNESWRPDWVLLLQPTSPLRTSDDIRQAISLAAGDSESDSVVSVVNSEKFHPLYARRIVDGVLRPYLPSVPISRRQDLDPVYCNNGAIYLTRTRTLIRDASLYGNRSIPYVMPFERSLDIDTEFDLRLASFLLSSRTH